MQQELQALNENNTWSVVSLTKEKKGLQAIDGYTRLNLEQMAPLRDKA